MLRYTIILSTLLMTAVNVRAQCERPAAGANQVLVDELANFPDGATVSFRCATGYVRASGARSITCTGTQWSELQLQCKKRSCGHPGEINNGKYLYPQGIEYGATITAVCDEGYKLVGTVTHRNCRETGWDGRALECEVAKCEKPPSITNGEFQPEQDSYDYGEAVIYSCKRGLDLIGPSEITCSTNGTFRPLPPRCLRVLCESPQISNAVKIEGRSPPYTYNNILRYQCNKGYRMNGSDFLTCKEDGWNPHPPQCNVITCLKPAIDNGLFNPLKELYEYGQTVTYSCNEGFRLIGASTIACTDDGTFQSSPQCVVLTCDAPNINNAVIVGPKASSYNYNVSIRYRCKEGYRMEGSDFLTCRENGWNPPPPKCNMLTCAAPNINNVVIVGPEAPSYNYNVSIRYRCKEGYRMEGSDFLTCRENGWNPPPPKCNIVTCSKPPVINDGHFIPLKERYEYGQTVTYSCKEGFRLQGTSTILCTDDGTFQPSPPQCVEATCDELQIKNGVVFKGKMPYYEYKSSVKVQCDTLYKMEGSDYLTCEDDGWNPPPPQCSLNWIWIVLIVFTAILGLLVCVCLISKKQFKKHRESDTPEVCSKSENCSLVNMSSSALKTGETPPKSMY